MNISTYHWWLTSWYETWRLAHKEIQPSLHWLKLSFPITVILLDFQLPQGGLIDGYRLYFPQLLVALRERRGDSPY
ncbi:MAG: hypothetical protein GC192_23370 [Bacteroidetes bacterium]|nr:hypothetical protein [Bacteroidota bacterium]